MRNQATVPIQLVESEKPTDCNVVFESYRDGNIVVLRVEKPFGPQPLSYAEIELPRKTLDWIEDWLHDNWAEY